MRKQHLCISLKLTILLCSIISNIYAQEVDSISIYLGAMKDKNIDSFSIQKKINRAVYIAYQQESPDILYNTLKSVGSFHYKNADYDQALFHYNQAADTVLATSNPEINSAYIYYNLGITKEKQGIYKDALEDLLKSEELFDQTNARIYRLYNAIGGVFTELGTYYKALEYLDKSLKYYSSNGSDLLLAQTQFKRANVFDKLDDYQKAYELIKASLEVLENQGSVTFKTNAYNTLGAVCIALSKYEEAISALTKALSFESIPPEVKAHTLNNFGALYERKREFNTALDYYKKSSALFKKLKLKQDWCMVENNIGKVYYDLGDYEESLQYLRKCLNSSNTPSTLMDVYVNLGASHYWSGTQDSALYYWQKYDILRVSAQQAESKAKTLQSELSEQEAILKNQQIILKNQQLKTSIITFLLVVIILASIFSVFFIQQRKKRQFAEKDKIRAEEKMNDTIKQLDLKTKYAQLRGQDEARRKMAADMHESLGGTLSAIILYLSRLSKKIDYVEEKNKQRYNEAFDMLRQAHEQVRTISKDMTNANLVKYGLIAELKDLAKRIERIMDEKLKVELHVEGLEKRINNFRVEDDIFKVVHEITNNVMKHAEASKIIIHIKKTPQGQLFLTVEDNGRGGIDFSNLPEESGIGLMNIEARVNELGGKINYQSIKNEGTKVAIDGINLN